jgi:hypothetical protein
MDLGVRRIVELLQHITVRGRGYQFFGLCNRSLHTFGPRGEHDFRPEGAQHHASFRAHGFGHSDNQFVAFDGGHESQPDPGVAAGRLDERGFARLNLSGALGILDHADADAVFHAAARIHALQLGNNRGFSAGGHFIQADKRRVSDEFGYVIGYLHRLSPEGVGKLAGEIRWNGKWLARDRLATTTTTGAGAAEAAGAGLSVDMLICIDALHGSSDSG